MAPRHTAGPIVLDRGPVKPYIAPMDFDVDELIFRTVGRAPREITHEVVRELEPDDIRMLAVEKGYEPTNLKRIGNRHHALARCLASGMSQKQAALTCNYIPAYVSILLDDPAFQELLEFYRTEVEFQYLDLHEQLAGIAKDAAWELQDRLEKEPEKLSISQLMELTKMGADRTGHGPGPQAQTNVQNNYVVALPEKASSVDDWKQNLSPTKMIELKKED